MIDWNIQSRSHHCLTCQKPFEDKQVFHTLLFDQKREYQRIDVCQPCWDAEHKDAHRETSSLISHWLSTYSVPPPAPPEPIQKETAESLLRKLVEQNDPKHAAARFILGAMLERKRLLKTKAQVVEDGQRVFIYEHPKSGDLFKIADPNLRLDQLEEVQRDVAQLLENGLPAAPSETGTAPPSEAPPEETSEHEPATLEPAQSAPA